MTSAYERNRKKRPKVKGYSINELNISKENKLGSGILDNIGDAINETAFGQYRQEGLQKEAELKRKVYESSPEWMKSVIDVYDTPNNLELKILKGISDTTRIDERITTPLTYIGLTGGIRKLPKVTKQALSSRMGQQALNDLGVHLGYQYRSGKTTVDFAKKGFKKIDQKLTEKFSKDPSKRVVNVKAEEIIDEAFSYDIETIVKARNIYKHHPDAGWTSALTRARQLKGITNKGLIKGGEGLYDPLKDEVYIPPEERTGTQKGDPLMSFSGPTGSGPIGKITYRNIPNLDSFLSGQTTSLNRTTAGLIQNPNFKLGDFLQGINQELERVRRQYPNIDVDTNLQRFKWQWHHINPDKMPVDFYVGLNNVNDRDLITDTLLRETNVSAGMNPSNRIGLPTEVHDEITDWLDTEIGKRSEVITQKISDDFGFGLTLTGPGSRAAKLRFNQLFAQVPIQQRIPYIVEYGQKIAESSAIIAELMNQFDIFYDIPKGFRLDVDVNTMERMLARLDEGLPTIPTLREIISEVTDGMRIPVSDTLGRQGIAVPRDPNLIRAIDLEGMLRDHKNKQSVLNQRQITSIKKELNQIYQMNLDIKGASTSAYIRAWYNDRFGGTRRSGKRTGPN